MNITDPNLSQEEIDRLPTILKIKRERFIMNEAIKKRIAQASASNITPSSSNVA